MKKINLLLVVIGCLAIEQTSFAMDPGKEVLIRLIQAALTKDITSMTNITTLELDKFNDKYTINTYLPAQDIGVKGNDESLNPLTAAIASGNLLAITALLLNKNLNIDEPNPLDHNNTPLHYAASLLAKEGVSDERLSIFRTLANNLLKKANINALNDEKSTPLHVFIKIMQKNSETRNFVKIFNDFYADIAQLGADFTLKNNAGLVPLDSLKQGIAERKQYLADLQAEGLSQEELDVMLHDLFVTELIIKILEQKQGKEFFTDVKAAQKKAQGLSPEEQEQAIGSVFDEWRKKLGGAEEPPAPGEKGDDKGLIASLNALQQSFTTLSDRLQRK